MIISMLDETATDEKVIDYSADAFVVTSIPVAEMIEALMAVRSGEYIVARPNAAADSGQDSDVRSVIDLTTRQREILAMLRDGQSNKEIARTLALSPFTIRNHIRY
jgi:DNA-binding NarL/FixJ family response regulator